MWPQSFLQTPRLPLGAISQRAGDPPAEWSTRVVKAASTPPYRCTSNTPLTILTIVVFVLAGLGLSAAPAQAQPGAWTTVSSVNAVLDLVLDGQGRVWGVTRGGVVVVDPASRQIARHLTTDDGLHRLDATAIAYHGASGEIVIGYPDGMLDVIDVTTFQVDRLGDIERTGAYPNKEINALRSIGETFFAATGFGVVEFNLPQRYVVRTISQFPGVNPGLMAYALSPDATADSLWVAFEAGVAVAPLSADLTLPESWTVEPGDVFGGLAVRAIAHTAGRVFASTQTTNFIRENTGWRVHTELGEFPALDYAVNDSDGALFVAQVYRVAQWSQDAPFSPQIRFFELGEVVQSVAPPRTGSERFWAGTELKGVLTLPTGDPSEKVFISGNGPGINAVRDIEFTSDGFIAATSPFSDRSSLLDNQKGFSVVRDGVWSTFNLFNTPALLEAEVSLVYQALPTPEAYFFGSWGRGVVRYDPADGAIRVYNATTSSLVGWESLDPKYIVVAGLERDPVGRVWAVSRYASVPLYLLETSQEDWIPFPRWRGLSTDQQYAGLYIDSRGLKWIPLEATSTAGRGLLVLDTGVNPESDADDQGVVLSNERTGGNLPDAKVTAVVEDRDGEIWVGTERGIARYILPELIVIGGAAERQGQWLIAAEPTGDTPFLLRDIQVTAMAVNGANQKWIGTASDGLWLLNEEGSRILAHHTLTNSPLLSNRIEDLSYESHTGTLYITTDRGLILYEDVATAGRTSMKELEVYPLPFRYDQHSRILIDGLSERSVVTITTVDGQRIRRIEAKGGRMEWDALDEQGRRIPSGIYLALAKDRDGRDVGVGKLMIIR